MPLNCFRCEKTQAACRCIGGPLDLASPSKAKLVRNRARCKSCKVIVESTTVDQDPQYCNCRSIAVSGGLVEAKRHCWLDFVEELSEYEGAPIDPKGAA